MESACAYDPPCDNGCEHQFASTTLTDPNAKIRRSPVRGKRGEAAAGSTARGKRHRAGPAAGARLYGNRATVRLGLTMRPSGELWYQVDTAEGTFFVVGTGSVHDLAQRILNGGHWVR